MAFRGALRPLARTAFVHGAASSMTSRHHVRKVSSLLSFIGLGTRKPTPVCSATQQCVPTPAASNIKYDKDTRAHVYFLLDRSGSMSIIKDDVIGGFNEFLFEQQREGEECAGLSMTMVQFDSEDPKEVVFAGRDISDVPKLTSSTFKPRGMTPLFDALGSIISLAEEDVTRNANQEVIIVTFSDGHENASREHSKQAIFSRIEAKQKDGWTFVFLGANQDSYAAGGSLGFSAGNTQNFKFDALGAKMAWKAVSQGCQGFRLQVQQKETINKKDFFPRSQSCRGRP